MTTDQAPAGQASEDRGRADMNNEEIDVTVVFRVWTGGCKVDPLKQSIEYTLTESLKRGRLLIPDALTLRTRGVTVCFDEHVRSDQAAQADEYAELRKMVAAFCDDLSATNSWWVWCRQLRQWLAAHPAPPIETTGDEG